MWRVMRSVHGRARGPRTHHLDPAERRGRDCSNRAAVRAAAPPRPLLRDPGPSGLSVRRPAREPDQRRLGLPGRDPQLGRRLGHALADEAVAGGASTRLIDAFRCRATGHRRRLEQRFDNDQWLDCPVVTRREPGLTENLRRQRPQRTPACLLHRRGRGGVAPTVGAGSDPRGARPGSSALSRRHRGLNASRTVSLDPIISAGRRAASGRPTCRPMCHWA
jgi:hypothetical protein